MIPANPTKPAEDQSLNLYEKTIFSLLEEGIRPGGLRLTEHLIESCGCKPGDMILDIGCGSGISVDFIRKKYLYEATGIDLSGSLLKKGDETFPGLRLVQGNGMNLPFHDDSFNGVIAECSLSTMSDPARVLTEIKRILIPGGKLAISDVYIRQPDKTVSSGNFQAGWCLHGALIYDEIINMLNNSGFNIILWEDHSNLWKEFVAGLILNNFSVFEILACSSSAEKGIEVLTSSLSKAKPGYFCLIAGK